jgi:hypothetical protein
MTHRSSCLPAFPVMSLFGERLAWPCPPTWSNPGRWQIRNASRQIAWRAENRRAVRNSRPSGKFSEFPMIPEIGSRPVTRANRLAQTEKCLAVHMRKAAGPWVRGENRRGRPVRDFSDCASTAHQRDGFVLKLAVESRPRNRQFRGTIGHSETTPRRKSPYVCATDEGAVSTV